MRQFILSILLLVGCSHRGGETGIRVVEENGSVIGVAVPQALVKGDPATLKLSLEESETPVLGQTQVQEGQYLFVPVVPLTRGLTYVVSTDQETLGFITVPGSREPAPELEAIYPQSDTVPENLLKVYLRFSRPMMEGRSGDFVHLLKDGRDTMKGTFLDLQPELWNTDGTVLTLWLDPGRIKLDLIPNKELGSPLIRGTRYELVVSAGWRSREGIALVDPARKSILVGDRDDQSPDMKLWSISAPGGNTRDALVVDFMEPLDRLLAEEAITVLDGLGNPIKGKSAVSDEDSQFEFVPDAPWPVGAFFLTAESRLEDLSGNNLNRLFETDLSKAGARKDNKVAYQRQFVVK